MEGTVLGKAIHWSKETKQLEVNLLESDKTIYLDMDEITMYPTQRTTLDGIPLEIANVFKYDMELIPLADGQGGIKYSHRAAMIHQYTNVSIGDVLEATVTAVTKISLFMQSNDLTVCCNCRQVSNSFYSDLRTQFHIGDTFKVKVINKDDSRFFIDVSIKACCDDSFSNYSAGDIVNVRVSKRLPSNDGYYVEISPVVYGVMDTLDDIPIDSIVVCRIRKIEPDRMRSKLTLIALKP